MSSWTLAIRGLVHFRRAHFGVVLGCMGASAVLVGALIVGDSVRISLRDQAIRRIGAIDVALVARERWFRSQLANDIQEAVPASRVAPILSFPGIASVPGGGARTGIVDVHGVDRRFFELAPRGAADGRVPTGARRSIEAPGRAQAFLNQRLAAQLNVTVGDRVLIRMERPSFMPRDMVMASVDEMTVAMRVDVARIVGDDDFGRFGLRASQVPPFNVFLDLQWLQGELELVGKANALLASGDAGVAAFDRAMADRWILDDAGVRVRELPGTGVCEVSSERIFLEDAVVESVSSVRSDVVGLLTYFVNTISGEQRSTPYSMITGVGALSETAPPALAELLALAPGDDGITITDWLANDGKSKVGSTIGLEYFVMGGDLRLREESHALTVRRIVPISGAAKDPTLMPEFPGLHDVDNCRDWEPGIPIDLDRIEDADEEYWDTHRGTPKAYVSLATAQRLWGNRFGKLTALRTSSDHRTTLENLIPRRLDPARLGLFFMDVRAPALMAGNPATDFGGLFLGLSFFLIVAALLLTALLFVFGIEQRAHEIGVLLAVGFSPSRVRRGFLTEAVLLATIGAVLGAVLGLAYTSGVLWALGTLWKDAVGATTLELHVQGTTMAVGALAAVAVSVGAIFLALRKAFDQPATALLASRGGLPAREGGAAVGRTSFVIGVVAPIAALALALGVGTGAEAAAGAFFGAGTLLLIGGGAWCRRVLVRWGAREGDAVSGLSSPRTLGTRNAGRRVGRSMATILLLASGAFLVVAVQAYRLEAPRDPSDRSSGTGGFALFGRSTLPVPRDLGSPEGREAFGIGDDDLKDVAIVPLRVREGDDASCLNLSRPQNPRLVSVRPEDLAERGAFTFASVIDGAPDGSPWRLLAAEVDGAVPAIGDQASVQWSLHKALGDTLQYRDENGLPFEVKIVATVANSVLQGNLLISEEQFRRRFPSASGYRMFLVDAPADRVDAVSARLTGALEDVGLELTETGDRLQAFNAVQNTYLLIFQALGGLGLLLGSCGLGAVVLRNALERRAELAVLMAVGWRRSSVRGLIWIETGFLLALGLSLGGLAAAVATMPGWLGSGSGIAVGPMVALVLVVLASGALWVTAATLTAVRGPLLEALRDD